MLRCRKKLISVPTTLPKIRSLSSSTEFASEDSEASLSNSDNRKSGKSVAINSPEDPWSQEQIKKVFFGSQDSSKSLTPSNIRNQSCSFVSASGAVVSWHPKIAHPYEHTKQLPREEDELKEGDSALKIQLKKAWANRHRGAGPTDGDLQNMFYTNKHEWLPRSGGSIKHCLQLRNIGKEFRFSVRSSKTIPVLSVSGRNSNSLLLQQRFYSTSSVHEKPSVLLKQCGRVSYAEGLKLQDELIQKHLAAIKSSGSKNPTDSANNILLLLEHDPVYTVGLRSDVYSKDEEERLLELGAEFHRTDRGGLITFHGPGQLVAYPIIDLGSFHKTGQIRWYVSQLEKTLVRTCMKMGIPHAGTSPLTGVWVGSNLERKIAAIGIHVAEKRVTSHGVALNCDTDMAWFQSIVPCGIHDKEVTSLSKELGRNVSISDVTDAFVDAFAESFACSIVSENAT